MEEEVEKRVEDIEGDGRGGRGWKRMEEGGRGRKSVEEGEKGWKRVEEGGREWKRVEEEGRGWKRVEEDGRGWKRMEEGESSKWQNTNRWKRQGKQWKRWNSKVITGLRIWMEGYKGGRKSLVRLDG